MVRYRESKKKMKKMGSYDMVKSHVGQTYTSDWSAGQEGAMKQYDNGSMNYYNRKSRLDTTDSKKIASTMLDQSSDKY